MLYKTVLFDLDGTLLPLDVEKFLKIYTTALANKVAHITDPKTFVNKLLDATSKVIKDKNPNFTNEEVFWKHFLVGIEDLKDTLLPVVEEFYAQDFPKLGTYIEADGKPAELVKELKQQGYRIALATNAVFPRTAVIDRMRWAHLDPEDFELITTYENMHYCKPHVEYYQEVLNHLQEDPGNCIMVGNDIEEDMVAGSLGMKTFLLDNFVIDRGSNTPYDYRGDLALLSQVLGLK